MNEIQIFNKDGFGNVRTIEEDGKILFIAIDVAKSLGYKDTTKAIKQHCRWVAKRRIPHPQSKDKEIEVNVIPEGDIYRLVANSELPNAEKFESWVFDEVIPSIRANGGYENAKPLTAMEQLKLQGKALIEVDEKVESLANDFNAFKNDMPILALECERITNAKNRKVVGIMGGKDSNAYNNNSLRSKVYRDVDSQLRREFGIKTYKAIKRNQCDKAIEIVENYQLPACLKEQIDNENAQMRFDI